MGPGGGRKGDHHNIGAGGLICPDGVEFIGLMKEQLSLAQRIHRVARSDFGLPPVNIYDFPEVMALSRKDIARRELKIVKAIQFAYVQGLFKLQRSVVSHMVRLPLKFLFNYSMPHRFGFVKGICV